MSHIDLSRALELRLGLLQLGLLQLGLLRLGLLQLGLLRLGLLRRGSPALQAPELSDLAQGEVFHGPRAVEHEDDILHTFEGDTEELDLSGPLQGYGGGPRRLNVGCDV